ncbi:MAG: hypothetical protein WBB28_12095, partial [Crinalium sp.]
MRSRIIDPIHKCDRISSPLTNHFTCMTRQSHDQFAKEYLEELLAPLGTIKQSKKVKSEIQEIDV